jgi:hypothetical protein
MFTAEHDRAQHWPAQGAPLVQHHSQRAYLVEYTKPKEGYHGKYCYYSHLSNNPAAAGNDADLGCYAQCLLLDRLLSKHLA